MRQWNKILWYYRFHQDLIFFHIITASPETANGGEMKISFKSLNNCSTVGKQKSDSSLMLKSPATHLELWHGMCATHCWLYVIFIKAVSFLLVVDKQSQCEVALPKLVPMGSRTRWILAERCNWSSLVSAWRHRRWAATAQSPVGSSGANSFQKRGIPLGSLQPLATFVPFQKKRGPQSFSVWPHCASSILPGRVQMGHNPLESLALHISLILHHTDFELAWI